MPRMTRYLHTMYRITDPERSRSFYEAEFRRDMDIVRGGEKEAARGSASSRIPMGGVRERI
jgi:hypothetical protein